VSQSGLAEYFLAVIAPQGVERDASQRAIVHDALAIVPIHDFP
jgi:hypothetical protein